MSYTALYRKYRPSTFDEMIGQDAAVTTLRNQVRAGRVGHAYLLCGTRGTGKTTAARILAKAVNCEDPKDGNPCCACASCRAIAEGRAMDVIEIDGASNNGVDNVRQIRDEVGYLPAQLRKKVYIIDEVHMLSPGAFNALLKTLEEPPEHALFILATTAAQAVPVTILSRCQRFDFRRIPVDLIAGRLAALLAEEKVDAEEKAVRYIAGKADGAMRDALSLADQCISFYYGETLTYEKVLAVLGAVDAEVLSGLLRCVAGGDVPGLLARTGRLIDEGRDLSRLVSDFVWYLRNLLLLKVSDGTEDILDVSEENLKLLTEEAAMIRTETLLRYIRVLSDLSAQMRTSAEQRVTLETAFIRLCRPQMQQDVSSLAQRIRVLEEKLEKGTFVAAAGTPAAAGAGAAAPAAAQEEPEIRYEKAVPKDLELIAGQWQGIIADLHPGIRTIMARAKLKFSSEEESTLVVVFGDFLGERITQNDQMKPLMERLIAEKTGRAVNVRFLIAGDAGEEEKKLREIRIIKEAQQAFVNMDIETEEEE